MDSIQFYTFHVQMLVYITGRSM